MKKFLPFILIVFIIVNLFAPISVELKDNKFAVNKNVALAVDTVSANDLKIKPQEEAIRTAAKKQCLNSSPDAVFCYGLSYVVYGSKINLQIYTIGERTQWNDYYSLDVTITAPDGTIQQQHKGIELLSTTGGYTTYQIDEDSQKSVSGTQYDGYLIRGSDIVKEPNTDYKVDVSIKKIMSGVAGIGDQTVLGTGVMSQTIHTEADLTTGNTTTGSSQTKANNGTDETAGAPGTMPGCAIVFGGGTFLGCVAQTIYYVIFQPTSFVFALTGVFFDNTFAYSVTNTSYSIPFVLQGWTVVRDFCNMFFIFILLYIAFQTVLSLHNAKTKESIMNVIIIGVLINFSLFTTQVIIDASNILARVFYNSNAIKITQSGGGVTNLTTNVDSSGIIPLSAALVNKVNPQSLIINSSQINTIKDTSGKSNAVTNTKTSEAAVGVGTFILVTLLASAVNIVGLTVFLTVGLIFILRVVGLWLAMIFAPFAFFSYAVPIPAIQGLEMVGWKNWWADTFKMAFLAPVFIFFLYLVLKFLEGGGSIVQTSKLPSGLTLVLGIMIPFVFIMALLLKAKDIAIKLAGTMGELASKAGSMVGGAVMMAATGGASMAATATIGRAGSAISQSSSVIDASTKKGPMGFAARMALKAGGAASKASFDVRNTQAGAAAGKSLGVNMGKGRTGGYEKSKADQLAKSEARKKQLELSSSSEEKKKVREEEVALQTVKNKNGPAIEEKEIALEAAKKRMAESAVGSDDYKNAVDAIKTANKELVDIKNGGFNKITGEFATDNGKIGKSLVDENETAAKDAEIAATKAQEELTATTKKENEARNKAIDAIKKETDPAEAAAREALALAGNDLAKSGPARQNLNNIIKANEEKIATRTAEINTASDANLEKAAEIYNKKREEANKKREEANKTNEIAKGGTGRSLKTIERTDLVGAKRKVTEKENERKFAEAERISSKGDKIINMVITGGQYSSSTADTAAHNLRMNVDTKAASH